MSLLDILKFVTLHFELYQGRDDQYYFKLKNAKGDTVLFSEGYTTKASTLNGINSVKKHGTDLKYYIERSKSFSL